MSSIYRFKNLGNTCYFNTALQLLLCSSRFRSSLDIPNCEIARELRTVLNTDTKKSIDLTILHNYYIKTFNVTKGTPEDCNECLVRLINQLNDDDRLTYNDMFIGKLKTMMFYDCSCAFKKQHTEDFVSIHLMNTNSRSSVSEMIRTYLSDELLDVELLCDRCKDKTSTLLKKKRFTKLPDVLVINMISPCRGLEIHNLLSFGTQQFLLKGIGLYDGSHYYACVLDNQTMKYYVANDDTVGKKEFDIQQLSKHRCSLFVYEKITIVYNK